MEDLINLDLEYLVVIGAAVFCGGAIGLERQLNGKAAGMRTSILICTGAAIFVELGGEISGGDPTRVLGQLITGIGFLGAGVMFTKDGNVSGVTTAAVIWMLAAIGALIGFGKIGMGLSITALSLVVLVGLDYLESRFKRMRRGVHQPTPKIDP